MNYLQVIILAIIQGLAELLPVSSSAHVIVAAKLMGLKASSPEMTFLIVMLHTGTMFAVIAYFWNSWKKDYFSSAAAFKSTATQVVIATAATGIVGFGLKTLIEKVMLHGTGSGPEHHAEVEQLFDNLPLIAAALASAGALILISGSGREEKASALGVSRPIQLTSVQSAWIGMVQGLCLPFRGFSRSGATISAGMLAGVTRLSAERFSFALAVVLTPAIILKEGKRFLDAQHTASVHMPMGSMALFGLIGMICSFAAGLLALRWLSGWLEHGRWQWFGGYCLVAAVVFWLSTRI